MQLELIFKVLLLVAIANGAPLVAKKLLGNFLAYPLDAGAALPDGGPLFGAAKTIRGIVVCVIAAALGAPLLGLAWTTGALIGATAMAGDLLSSFVKRRMGWPPSSRALGLDQIPESLFPALACMPVLGLTLADVIVIVAAFTVGGLGLSLLLFKIRLRDQPH
jgi:CDP-2,3-bis-(O-geranylgeranyl)-sn-glycerol synthase